MFKMTSTCILVLQFTFLGAVATGYLSSERKEEQADTSKAQVGRRRARSRRRLRPAISLEPSRATIA